jgi:putative ABC transport system ATP-binding protein
MTPILKLVDVSLVHGDGDETVHALDHVSLEVSAGEFVAIVGPSGSGKSSLLAVAGALTKPTSGSVHIGELALSQTSPKEFTRIRRERIGFVFQSGNLLPALTSIDQVRLPLTFGPVDSPRDPRDLLAKVGMEHKAQRRPHQLSGGEKQRVGIARALVTSPQVLLIDEPTAALDRQRAQDVVELIARETHDRGVATIMVTHDQSVLHHCDRVLEMVDGRLSEVR